MHGISGPDGKSAGFGDYAEALAKHQLTRTALRLELSEYKDRLEESLITQEIFDAQERRIARQQQRADERPSLPFRMPVQWVNRPTLDFRGFAGTIASGRVRRSTAFSSRVEKLTPAS